MVMLEKRILVIFSRPVMFQISLHILTQMHVVVFSESEGF